MGILYHVHTCGMRIGLLYSVSYDKDAVDSHAVYTNCESKKQIKISDNINFMWYYQLINITMTPCMVFH